jgi:hypothetical protein
VPSDTTTFTFIGPFNIDGHVSSAPGGDPGVRGGVRGAGYGVQGAGCRVPGAGCRVQGAWCGAQVRGAGCGVQGAGRRCGVQGAGCRVRGAGCGAQGAGCRVRGAGCGAQVRGAALPTPRDTVPLCHLRMRCHRRRQCREPGQPRQHLAGIRSVGCVRAAVGAQSLGLRIQGLGYRVLLLDFGTRFRAEERGNMAKELGCGG